MNEYIINLHMHTVYSDGHGNHQRIADAALETGIDVVIVTDHNVWVSGPEGYYSEGDRRVLMMIGEEIHDQARDPQKNHMLVIGAEKELASHSPKPQSLINAARKAGALTFLAHPKDPAAPAVGEGDLSWVNWDIHSFTGIELWNGLSEFKSLLKTKLHAVFYAYNPERMAHGPFPEVLAKWDELTTAGAKVVAVGGSDGHELHRSMGPLKRVLFPYEYHFNAVNTHILTETPFNGEYTPDRKIVLEALRRGHAFVGYDLPAPTKGFRFKVDGEGLTGWMGDEVPVGDGITLQIKAVDLLRLELLGGAVPRSRRIPSEHRQAFIGR